MVPGEKADTQEDRRLEAGNSERCLVAAAEQSRLRRLQGRWSETHAAAAGQDVSVCPGRGRVQNSSGTLARCRHGQCPERLGE